MSIEHLARLLTGIAVFSAAVSAFAAVPTFWRLESQSDFLAGDTEGVSIASDGTITLSPAAQVLSEPTDPQLWSLAADASGNIYAGSGNDGRVHKFDSSGNATVIADTNELQVHALATDRRGNLYAGTSPRGAVYRIDREGKQEVFFDPEDRYIWALATDSSGNLLVATGDKAQIYRVSGSGQSEVLFTSEETHIVSLAIDSQDNVYAGTDSNGLVLKIDGTGATSVLFDTPFQEVRALVLDTRGNVYAATVNGGVRASSPPPPPSTTTAPPTPSPGPPPTIGGGESITVTAVATAVASGESTSSASSSSAKGGLYRVSPDGAAEQLWETREDTPLSLSLAPDDRLMVGTGTEGRLYLVGQDKLTALLLSVEADQVTAIHPGERGETYLATANPAKLYRLNRGRRTEGTYRSPARDTDTVSSWGRIRWEARTPTGTTVRLQTRSGNSAEPDNTWSDWSEPYSDANGEQITSPRGRFFQWRAVLNSTGEVSAELFSVTAIYLQQNLDPEITEITLHPPGQTFQKPISATGQLEILGMDGAISDMQQTVNGRPSPGAGQAAAANFAAMSRPLYHKGFRTVTWNASDPNEDELTYDVHYRAEGETLWRVLREGLDSSVIAWDTVAMPDGRYTLRIVASDAPSNPADMARTGEKVSRSFEVDNTPPRINGLSVQQTDDGYRVRFVAEDDISPIRTVEYAINSGKWNVVFPTDGIADSRQERFELALTGYRDGVYTLVVKVTDTLDNTATARAELR